MKKISAYTTILAVIAMIVLYSCNFSQQNSTKVTKSEIEQDVKDLVYPMPTAFEVTEMLNRIGAAYILTLSNDPSKASNYLTERKQALNLGIYGADLSYASTYRQKQATMDFLNASKKLIEELDLNAAMNPELLDKIENSNDDKDVLVKLITNTFYDTYAYLNKTGRPGVAAIVLTGTWVEGLYIATHISEDTFNDKEMVKIVMDQKESLAKMHEILDKNTANSDVAEIITTIAPIKAIFDSIDGSISESQLISITEKIRTIRDQFIN